MELLKCLIIRLNISRHTADEIKILNGQKLKMSIIGKLKQIIKGGKKSGSKISIRELHAQDLSDKGAAKGKRLKHKKEAAPVQEDIRIAPQPNRQEKNDTGAKKKRNNRNRKNKRLKRKQNEDLTGVNIGDIQADFGSWSIEEFYVEPEPDKTRFHDLGLPDRIMKGIYESGYKYCTPIQALILPEACLGKDVSGKAQTGTGKTAAFLVTLFKRLMEKDGGERENGTPRALIMAPTRELVIQIEKDARLIGKYCGLTMQSVFGGINYEKQKRQLEDRVIDILVATPGRLLDYKEQGILDLSKVEILVIDEADRMLDMGFIPDMKKIIGSTPPKGRRQTMLFSATLSSDILKLVAQWTKDPLSFEAEAKEITSENIEQKAYIAVNKEKFPIMYNIIKENKDSRIIIFGNRRDEVASLADMLKACGISCAVLSGDVTQSKRIKSLEDLRCGRVQILCATDVAARGIHIDGITHVFNFSLPDDPEDYVHRIGRTGRAGEKGISVIFATEEDSYLIPKIEAFTKHKLRYINPDESIVTLPDDIKEIVKRFKPLKSGNSSGNFKKSGRNYGTKRSGRR